MHITMRIIPTGMFLLCDTCAPDERRVKLYFADSERSYLSVSIVLRYLKDSIIPEKMTATIISNGGGIIPTATSPTETRVPYDEYLMIKQ